MINVPGTGAFVGEFGGSGFRVLHFDCGQGWLIRRLFEVRTLFILVCLLRRLRGAGCVPSVIHARFNHLCFDYCSDLGSAACLEASHVARHFEQQATFLSTAHSLGRRVCCFFDHAIES